MANPTIDIQCEIPPARLRAWSRAVSAGLRWWALLVLLAAAAGTGLGAATVTWTGAGADNNWTTGANWGGTAPSPGDALVFAGSTRPTPNNDFATAGLSYASITFSAGATAFTISGQSITLTGGVTNSSSSTQTFSLAMALSGTVTVTATTNPVVLNGVLSGTGALTTAGASSVTVNANGTYTGGTTVSAGTLNAGGTALGTGLVTVSAGGTLAAGAGGAGLFGQFVSSTPVTTNFNALATLQAHFATKVPGLFTTATTLNSGGGYASPFGSGTQNFEALFTGTLTIATAGNYTFNTTSDDGSMLFIDGAVVVNNNGLHGTTTVTSAATPLTAGAHSLAVAMFNAGGGYSLNAQISGVGNTTMVDITTANAVLTPAHLDIGSLAGAGAVSLAAGDLVVGRDNTNSTFSGVISGAGSFNKIGTGTLTLSGTSTWSGQDRIVAGAVQVGAGGTTGALPAGAVFDNGTLIFARSDSISVANLISGTGGVTMNGSGTLTLTQNNAYTGATTVSLGTLDATGAELGTSAVTVAAGATLAVTGGSGLAARYFNVTPVGTNFNSLTLLQGHLSGQSLILANTAATLNMGTTGASFPSPYNSSATNFEAFFTGRIAIGTGGTYTFNTSSDDGSVLFVDGTLVVNNNATQGITLKTGTIALTSGVHDLALGYYNGASAYGLNAQISGAGNTTMVDLSTANATLTPDLIIGSLAGAGTVALTDGGLITGFDGTSTSFSGVISGPGGLVKRGAGTFTLSGASTYTGPTTVAGATLKLASGTALGNTAITVCSGATLAPDPPSTTMAIGTTGAGTLGSMLTLGSGTVYDMTDGAVGTVALQQNASFATTPLTISGATLNVNIGSAGPDTLAATLGATTSGTNSIGITTVGANLTVGGSYPLISATGGLSGATWQFTGGGTTLHVLTGSTGYILTLTSSATAVTVAVGDGIDIWNGTTSTDWNTASNWSLGVVPTSLHDVQIGNGSGTFKAAPSVTAAGGTCQSLTFTGGAATVGAGTGTLTIGSGGLTASVAGSSIACPVALGAGQTWTSTVNDVAVSGVVSGAFALTKAGSGTLTLSGANTFTGGVTLSAGALNINNAAALGTAAGTFTIAGGTSIDNTSGGAITIAANNPETWNGDFTFTGSNALNLATAAITLGAATRTVTASGSTLTIGGVISGSGGLGKSGAGTVTLTGANTMTGGVTLSAGTLNINNAAALGAVAGTFTIAGGTIDNTSGGALTITANNPGTWSGNFTFTGSNALNLGTGAIALGAATRTVTVAASTLALGGVVSGTGGLGKLGAGTLTLTGANTYSGGMSLGAGTLNINSATALGAYPGTFTVAGGTTFDNTSGGALTLTSGNPQSWTGDFTFTGSNALNLGGGAVAMGAASRQVTVAASTLTVAGPIAGSGGLVKAGAGTLGLSATCTYAGGTDVLAGTLALQRQSLSGFGTTGTGWTRNGGTTIASDVVTLTDNGGNEARSAFYNGPVPVNSFTVVFRYQAGGNKAADGSAFVLHNDSRGSSAVGAGGGQLGYGGITTSAALGMDIFTTNTIGTRYFTNGTVATPYTATSPVNFGGGNQIQVSLNYDGATSLVEALTDLTTSSTFNTTLTVGAIPTTVGTSSAFIGFSGGTGGAVAIQSISNFTYIGGGTNALPSGTALTIAAGATVDLGGCGATVASLANNGGGGGTVTNSGGADGVLTVSGGTTTSFSGTISDGVTNKTGLARSGTGALTLSGTQTYTGATTVSGGTLVVTGATANGSAVAVSSGGTLAGTGTVGGAVTMGASGVLAPGTGGTTIGTLTTGAITGNATSTFSVDLDGAGPTSDRATTAGTVACAGTLTVASAGTAAIGKVYTIVSAGTVTGTFSGLVNGALFNAQGRTFQIAYTSTTVTLTDVARPTTRVWDGGGADNNWTTAANWDFDLAPSAGDDLQFAGSTRTSPNNDYAAATSFASITFNSGASAFTIGGNAITLAGSVTNSSASLQTVNLAMAMAATRSLDAASGDLALGGILSGAGGLTKLSANVLTLSGANTYTGTTTVSAGTLKANNAAALGTSAGGTVVSSGATLDVNGQNLGAERVTISGTGLGGNGALVNSGAAQIQALRFLTLAADASVGGPNRFDVRTNGGGETVDCGGFTLTKVGANQFSLVTVSVTGFTAATVSAGILSVEVGTNLGAGTTGVTVQSGGTLQLYTDTGNTCPILLNAGTLAAVNPNSDWSGPITLTGACTVSVTNATTLTLSGAIGGTGALTKTGADTLILSGANTWNGTTTVSAGTLKSGAAGVIPDSSAVTVASGATWNLNNFNETIGSLAGAGTIALGSATLTTGGDNTSTSFTGTANGTGGFIKNGTGTYSLTTASTNTGKWVINAGLVSIANTNNFGTAPGSFTPDYITLNGGGVVLNTTTTPSANRGFTLAAGGGSLAASAGNTWTVATVITGPGSLTTGTGGTGTIALANTQTFAGTLTVGAGALQNAVANPLPDACAVTVASGAVYDLNGFSDTIGSLAGAGNVSLGAATLTCGGNNTSTTYSGVMSGGGALSKAGSGTLTFSTATSTYTGGTSIGAGTLQVGTGTVGTENAAALGTGTVTVNTGGTLWFKPGVTATVYNVANSFALNGGTIVGEDGVNHLATGGGATIAVGGSGGTLKVAWTTKDIFLDGILTGSGPLAVVPVMDTGSPSGVWFNNDSSTYAGTVTVTSAATTDVFILINTPNALKFATIALVSAGANPIVDIDTPNATTTIAGLSGSAGIVQSWGVTGNYALTINAAANSTYGGVLRDLFGSVLAVTKSGAGTLTLAGTNTYTPATTVSGGTLLVSGSTAAASAVGVANTATLGGTGTVAGTITLAAGSTLAPGLGGTAIGTLTTGSLTGNATSTLSIDLNGATPTNDAVSTSGTVACAGTLTIASITNAAVGKVYTIVSAGTVSGTFSGLANNAVFSQAGRLFRIAYGSTTVTLTDCAPLLTSRQTLDTDGNGRIDRIRLTFDQALNDATSGLTVTVAGYAVTGYSTGTANDAVLDVLLAESGAGDTGATPAVRITANTTLTQAGGTGLVQVEGSATAATDAAAPVLLSAAWTDGGAGGVSAGDTVTMTFSESVTATSLALTDLGLPVTSDTLSSTTIADQTGSTLTMTVAGSPRLTPGGTYSAAATGAGKPSGIFLASGSHIHDAVGLTPATGSGASAVDLGPGTSTVAIAWATGSDPRSWALGTLTVGTIANSIASGVDLTVLDSGNCNVDLSIASAVTAPSSWGPAASAGANAYLMKAATSAAASGAPANPASYALTLATAGQGLTSGLLSGATSAYALYFQAPTTITSGSATQQTIVISITAALAP